MAEIESLEKELGFLNDGSLSCMNVSNDSNANVGDSDLMIRSPFEMRSSNLENVNYSFGLADAESEREQIQDQYNDILYRNEELEAQHILDMQLIDQLRKLLRSETAQRIQLEKSIDEHDRECQTAALQIKAADTKDESQLVQHLREDLERQRRRFEDLEFRLAQAKCALASAQQSQEDFLLAQELSERERIRERTARLLAEKERDAFAAAYEASVQAFGKVRIPANKPARDRFASLWSPSTPKSKGK